MKDIVMKKGPIGAVVKEADYIFTNLARRTASFGVFYRIDWQLLNYLRERKQATDQEVRELLYSFGNNELAEKVLARFEKEDFVKQSNNTFFLTPKGERVYEEVAQIQEKIKIAAMQGITEPDYEITVQTLQKMMGNVKEYLPAKDELKEELMAPSAKPSANRAADIIEIKQVVAQIEAAHNQKDPRALAGPFTETAVFANAAGKRLYGREAIYASAKSAMATFMSQSFARYEVAHIRFITDEVAIVEVNQYPTSLSGELLPGEVGGIPTYIMSRNAGSGRWQILYGQNTIVKNDWFSGKGSASDS